VIHGERCVGGELSILFFAVENLQIPGRPEGCIQAVELAVKAAKVESVAGTGTQWYDASNMGNPETALLIYD
jgi:hypothetical protein